MQPRSHRRRPFTWLYIAVGSLLLLSGLGYAALRGKVPAKVVNRVAGLFVQRQAGAVPWQPAQPVPGGSEQPVNVLILGLQLGGASTNPLTDAMLVASYDPRRESVSLLSIPRDLWVAIPGHGEGRINEAFQDAGPAGAMLTVQQVLGIPLNYYALVDYTAFERLIDDVGGVTVDVPYTLNDPTFPAPDEVHYEPFHITRGVHRLNGHEALRYARERHADPQGDIGRAQRQQQVLVALRSELLKPGNLFRINMVLRDMAAMVHTDFPLDQAPGLALQAVNATAVRQEVLGYQNKAVTDYTTGGGAEVLLPDKAVVQGIVRELFADTLSYLQAGAGVRVDNGSGFPSAATEYTRLLAAMGASVLPPGKATGVYSSARVQAYTRDPARLDEARLLAGMLGTSLELVDGPESADVVVTLGRDYPAYAPWTEADWVHLLGQR